MSKKQALTEFHRGSILAAAERLFSAKGIEKTTMDDIAREAEYSKATLYVYFQSKEEIVCAIMLNAMVILRKRLTEASSGEKAWVAAYHDSCLALFHFYEENPAVYRLIIDVITGRLQEKNEELDLTELLRVSGEMNQILLAFLSRGVAEGSLTTVLPVEELSLLFWVWISGSIHTSVRAGKPIAQQLKKTPEQFFADSAALILRAFTRDDAQAT